MKTALRPRLIALAPDHPPESHATLALLRIGDRAADLGLVTAGLNHLPRLILACPTPVTWRFLAVTTHFFQDQAWAFFTPLEAVPSDSQALKVDSEMIDSLRQHDLVRTAAHDDEAVGRVLQHWMKLAHEWAVEVAA
ncbi:hypothetical protein [Nesterenkonia rhizosphaerae]|uniref:Uncharacterized protein n=1 Tax=Nesterenkonia rhizosphaerae TaxID=1348272 RepID=A0ABP9G077_9MICC